MMAFRLPVVVALLVVPLAVAPAADPDDVLKVDFGEKDKGKPVSDKPGQVTASGTFQLPPDYATAKVVLLLQRDGEKGRTVHEAELKDGKWSVTVEELAAGTYHVRARCTVTRPGTDTSTEVNCLPDPFEPTPYKVEVKGK